MENGGDEGNGAHGWSCTNSPTLTHSVLEIEEEEGRAREEREAPPRKIAQREFFLSLLETLSM